MVIRLVLQIAEGECAGGEFVLVGRCFACDECALQIGILSDQEIKAADSCKDARLISCTLVVGGDISLAEGASDIGHGEFAVDVLRVRCSQLFGLSIKEVDIPRDAKARGGILLLIGLFLLEGLDVQIPADSCRDLVSLHLAPNDVRILAGGDDDTVLCANEGRGEPSKSAFL